MYLNMMALGSVLFTARKKVVVGGLRINEAGELVEVFSLFYPCAQDLCFYCHCCFPILAHW